MVDFITRGHWRVLVAFQFVEIKLDDIQMAISATSIAASENSVDIQSVVQQEGEFVRKRTAAKILELHKLLEKTEPGSLLSLLSS